VAEAAAWKAELHARSLEKVIEAPATEISEVEEKARQAADRKEREATSRAFHAKADRFEKTLAPLIAALKEAGAATADLVVPFATNEGFSTLCHSWRKSFRRLLRSSLPNSGSGRSIRVKPIRQTRSWRGPMLARSANLPQ